MKDAERGGVDCCRCGAPMATHREVDECAGDARFPERTRGEIGEDGDMAYRPDWTRQYVVKVNGDGSVALIRVEDHETEYSVMEGEAVEPSEVLDIAGETLVLVVRRHA